MVINRSRAIRALLSLGTAVTLVVVGSSVSQAASATPKPGSVCKTVQSIVKAKGKVLTCTLKNKKDKKFIWVASNPIKIAAVFSGSTTDADYTYLGLQALRSAEKRFGATTTYSENVAVPDTERVMHEYLAEGYSVIWTHGSQYYAATVKLAAENPKDTFIAEQDTKPTDAPANVWVLDRNFHLAFYPLGILAANASKSGKIGYIGGATLPFSYSEVHAVEQALADSGSTAKITPVWVGDFNDPVKAQQITSQLISQGNDFILGSLNLGMIGAFGAARAAPAGSVLITAKYTDKTTFAPKAYVTSVIYDFATPLNTILVKMKAGSKGGYVGMDFKEGIKFQAPKNVSAAIAKKATDAVAKIIAGQITVVRNVEKIG